ncbi:hypothetical protein [Microvirga solisilvae]|nr:hypothetical protein [Microvirga solisilvae]
MPSPTRNDMTLMIIPNLPPEHLDFELHKNVSPAWAGAHAR